jgi:hypothetical protein
MKSVGFRREDALRHLRIAGSTTIGRRETRPMPEAPSRRAISSLELRACPRRIGERTDDVRQAWPGIPRRRQRMIWREQAFVLSPRSQGESDLVVEDHHVERGCRGAFVDEAPDVDIVVVGALVGQPVDQIGVAVIGENDRAVRREEIVEQGIGKAVRMRGLGL